MRCLAALLALALPSACTPSAGTDLGPGVLAIYVANETDVAGLFSLRAGFGVAVGLEVSTDPARGGAPLEGGAVAVATVPDQWVDADEVGAGLYRTPLDAALRLPEAGDPVTVAMAHEGRSFGLSVAVPPTLRLPLTAYRVPAGEALVVDLPEGWADRYDHLVATLLTPDGEVVWDSLPTTADGWLDTLARPPRPATLRVPAAALDAERVLAVAFLRQMDPEVAYEGALNEPVSGLWAGSAWLVPVEVR